MSPLKSPRQSPCQASHSSSLRPLESEELTQVAGGCSQCTYEMNPPSSLDAWRIQGGLNIPSSAPSVLQFSMSSPIMWQ